MDSISPETWLPVDGWPYEVSDHGRVRRMVGGQGCTRVGVPLKPWSLPRGYLQITLCGNGRKQKASVHTLVAAAFLGPRPYHYEVHHKDRVPSNNHVTNLVYVNRREHKNLGTPYRGERHPNAKLRTVDVLAIRACAAAGKPNTEIAKFFGVAGGTIDQITNGKQWKHLLPDD